MGAKDIIIGAGISGLSCGWVLRDKCILLEKEQYIGGLAITNEFQGFRFDLGGHRIFTPNQKIENFFRNLLGGELLEVKRKSKIYRNGKFLDYPLRKSVIFYLNPVDILTSAVTYTLRHLMPLTETSFEEITKNRFGDRIYQLFFRDYTEKVWGLKCKELSTELAETRLQAVSLKRAIEHSLSPGKRRIRSFDDLVLYPKNGIEEIPMRLSDGLDIRLDSEVTELVCSKDKIEKVVVNNSQEFECRNVVSTMPITSLIELLNPPEKVIKASRNLKYRDLICVFLVLNKDHYTADHWIYFPGNQVFGRLHEPKNWSSKMAPKNKTGVCIEIFCNKEDNIWKMQDSKIVEKVLKDMPPMKHLTVECHCVVRVEYAYPLYDVHYRKNLKVVETYLSSYKSLFTLGRAGTFQYINMDICVENGLRLGEFLNVQD